MALSASNSYFLVAPHSHIRIDTYVYVYVHAQLHKLTCLHSVPLLAFLNSLECRQTLALRTKKLFLLGPRPVWRYVLPPFQFIPKGLISTVLERCWSKTHTPRSETGPVTVRAGTVAIVGGSRTPWPIFFATPLLCFVRQGCEVAHRWPASSSFMRC